MSARCGRTTIREVDMPETYHGPDETLLPLRRRLHDLLRLACGDHSVNRVAPRVDGDRVEACGLDHRAVERGGLVGICAEVVVGEVAVLPGQRQRRVVIAEGLGDEQLPAVV